MSINKYLPELLNAGVITPETAEAISKYYQNKATSSTNRLFVIFGVLGAILIGLGIILIIAHNWDELPKTTKLFFAFLPLAIGQLFCLFTIIRKNESIAWRESSSVFLFFAVGASISLVSQIYNIPGDLATFTLTWMLLCLPMVFIMNSSITSLLYLVGITYYAFETSYSGYPRQEDYLYWLLLLATLVHYYRLYRTQPRSNFMVFHNWMVPLSLIITLGTVANKSDELMFMAYINLFSLFYLLGNSQFFNEQKSMSNGYRIMGSLGTIIVLLMLSFDWFWQDLQKDELFELGYFQTAELYAVAISLSIAVILLIKTQFQVKPFSFNIFSWVFVGFILIFLLYNLPKVSMIGVNLMVFALGLFTIQQGSKKVNLGLLNYGLLIITALVACRFLDSKISFVVRGIMFVLVGIGFFAANYILLKKKKNHETGMAGVNN